MNGSDDGNASKQREFVAERNLGRYLEALLLGESSFDLGVECLSNKRQLNHAEDGEEDESPLCPAPPFSADDE